MDVDIISPLYDEDSIFESDLFENYEDSITADYTNNERATREHFMYLFDGNKAQEFVFYYELISVFTILAVGGVFQVKMRYMTSILRAVLLKITQITHFIYRFVITISLDKHNSDDIGDGRTLVDRSHTRKELPEDFMHSLNTNFGLL